MLRKRGFVGTKSNEVTEREITHRLLARKAAAEGFVLLKNENEILPISTKEKIALYGAGAVMTIKGGTGSGDVNERDCVNIHQGFLNAGYQVTTTEWLENYKELYTKERLKWRDKILSNMSEKGMDFFKAYTAVQFQIPCGQAIDEEAAKLDGADVAFFVLSRIAGENADRHDCEGDYFITKEEKALLKQICRVYRNVVLVINTGGLIDLGFTDELKNIHGIFQFVQAGQEGGNAFADIVSGKISPSGKMTDTWALTYGDYPNADYFSYKSGDVFQEEYKEGIYVGYRYFDTFDVPVRFGFGYGLSYTEFAWKTEKIDVCKLAGDKQGISITLKVTNTGTKYAGKEVMQIYVSCPQTEMQKEFRRLVGFGKTEELSPGKSEKLKISFAAEELASYDEQNASWILEKGQYGIWVGNSLEAARLAGSLLLDETVTLAQCENICKKNMELEELAADKEKWNAKEEKWHKEAQDLPKIYFYAADFRTKIVNYTRSLSQDFQEAKRIVESLSLEQKVALTTGDIQRGQTQIGAAGQSVPGAAAETVSIAAKEPWNVASIVLADGPAGLRLKREYQVSEGKILQGNVMEAMEGGFFAPPKETVGETYYQYCTAIPVGTLLAQTWNLELMKELGEMIGHEMKMFEVTLWLAPGMNIHRNPLCGRNFEYYSEDPLLSGMMASAMTQGVQKVPGCGTTIKHFACNNQEDNRKGSDSIISERVLREIYLRGFEIAVKTAQPMSIMTSYNMINGVHAANSYDLCTKAARMEWGFVGAIMSDWTTTTESNAGVCTASGCLMAGNDLIMPGAVSDHENIYEALSKGMLTEERLDECVTNIVHLILQSNQYTEAVSYLEQFEELSVYMETN